MKGIGNDGDREMRKARARLARAEEEFKRTRARVERESEQTRAKSRLISSGFLEGKHVNRRKTKRLPIVLRVLKSVGILVFKCSVAFVLITLFFAGGWIIVAALAYSGNTDFILRYDARRNHWWRRRTYLDDRYYNDYDF